MNERTVSARPMADCAQELRVPLSSDEFGSTARFGGTMRRRPGIDDPETEPEWPDHFIDPEEL